MSTSVVPSSGRRTLLSVLAGAVAAFAGAVAFAAVIGTTQREFSAGSLVIGGLVGFVMARTVTPTRALAPVAGVLALAGCVLGEIMGVTALAAKDDKLPVLDLERYVLGHPGIAVDVLKASFSPMSLLFWAVAAYAGFSFVRKAVAELEARLAAEKAAAAPSVQAPAAGAPVAAPAAADRSAEPEQTVVPEPGPTA